MITARHMSIDRQKGLAILKKHTLNRNLYRHCLAVEAAMRALARRYHTSDPDMWGLVGLLHDADWGQTQDDPATHTSKTVEWMKEAGIARKEVYEAVLAHNFEHNGYRAPQTHMEWALYTCDDLTGLIVATALVSPEKKLSSITVDSVFKKFGSKSFAAGVNRNHIRLCETKLSVSLHQFVGIVLTSMQEIAMELGL